MIYLLDVELTPHLLIPASPSRSHLSMTPPWFFTLRLLLALALEVVLKGYATKLVVVVAKGLLTFLMALTLLYLQPITEVFVGVMTRMIV